jgi:hypothetical protein
VVEAPFDSQYLCADVPMAKLVSHQNWFDYLVKYFNKPGLRILELGSREVTVKSAARKAFSGAEYVGFDYYGGDNVDVVGDAHRVSSYFRSDEKFDLIYSAACFEHFAMPWVVAVEIAKLLNVGGFVFVETHFRSGRMSGRCTSFSSPTWRCECYFQKRWASSASRRGFPIPWSVGFPRCPLGI